MAGLFELDKQQARRAFSRAADSYDQAAVMQQEIVQRMLERLELVRIDPKVIVDLGCGTGQATELLMQRYPKAMVTGLDFSLPMLAHVKRRGRWLKRPRCLCADLDHLPLAPHSVDLLFSSSALQWSQDPEQAIAEIHRVLKPGGLLMFSSFGPDTLKELRQAWSQIDGFEHVHGFVDLHDYGDMMVSAGMVDPVMDMENISLTYANLRDLMRDLKAIGAGNAGQQRPRGLTGRARMRAVESAYDRFLTPDGRLPATYEVVYGHAWGAEQRRQGNETRVSIDVLKKERD